MKFAPVCPIHILEGLKARSPETLGDYFLLLAHDVLANAEAYTKFFVTHWEGPRPTIIMDNSVIELGDACNAEQLYNACKIVNATCIAIPDVLEDGVETIMRMNDFFHDWDELNKTCDFPKMFIPQGKDEQDFVRCVEYACFEWGNEISWIGIPRNLTGRIFSSRMVAVGYLDAMFPVANLHMLGFSADIEDDIETCVQLGHLLEGIDTAVPLRLASQLLHNSIPAGGYQEPGPRGNWWDEAEFNTIMGDNVLDIRHTIGEL